MIFILEIIVCLILMIVFSMLIYLPYHIVKNTIRFMLRLIGIDLYTEDEKVQSGRQEENRIIKLQRLIEIEDQMAVPFESQLETTHYQICSQRSSKKIKAIENITETTLLLPPKNISSLNDSLKVIESKAEKKTTVVETKTDDSLDSLSKMMEEVNKKYS
jgi:hypothetical protein